ncbi:MAG: PEGA domain-containing protein [Candidatus Kryptonium sp.]
MKILIFLFLTIQLAFSQAKYGFVNINTEPSGSFVYIDSELVGQTPIVNLKIKVGTYTLKIKNPELSDWLEQDISQRIEIKENDTLNIFITFEKFVKIDSNPFSADIFLGDSIIGTTPAIFKLKNLLGKTLKITKKGYKDAEVFIDGKTRKIEVNLTPQNGVETELRTEPKDKLKTVIPIVGVGLANGIISVYFKSKADKLYEEYLKTGDIEKLNAVKTYDKISGLTLVIFELTTAIAIYLLLKE